MHDKLLIRGDKKKFDLRNGMRSLRKKFGLPVVPKRIKGLKLPDDFYKMIDPDLVDTDRVGVFGTITKETLKRKVIEARDPAAAKAKLPAANIAATPEKKRDEKTLVLDVSTNGEYLDITVPKTGKQIRIVL